MKGREGGKMDQEEEDSLLISCVQCKGTLWFASRECCLALLCSAYELTGLSRGGQQVQRCKEVFGKAINLLVELASLQVRTGGEEGMGEGREGGSEKGGPLWGPSVDRPQPPCLCGFFHCLYRPPL